MKASKIIALTAAVLSVSLAPMTAYAAGATTTTTTTTTVDPSGQATTSTSKSESSSKPKAKKVTKKAAPQKVEIEVSVNDKTSPQAEPAQAQMANSQNLDLLRAEERARAAEQFRADEAKLREDHASELDRVRADERAAAEAREKDQIAAVRAEERARADRALAEAHENDEVIQDAALTPAGVYGFVGGGGTGFTQPGALGAASVGGYWDARVGVGSRSIIGAEVSYVGGARDIQALGLQDSAVLMNNGIEGVARLNVPITTKDAPVLFEPYTFAGVGWSRYNLVNQGNNTSSVQDQDDILTVPMGVGMQFGFNAFTLDLRGTYRAAVGSDLIGNSTSSFDATSLASWGAGASLGFEF